MPPITISPGGGSGHRPDGPQPMAIPNNKRQPTAQHSWIDPFTPSSNVSDVTAADEAYTASQALAASASASAYNSMPGSPLNRSHRGSFIFSSKAFLSLIPEGLQQQQQGSSLHPQALSSQSPSFDLYGSAPRHSLAEIDENSIAACFEKPLKPKLATLPPEILTIILQYVALMSSPELAPRELARLLPTCFSIYDVGVAVLYRRVAFPYPHTFDKFRRSIEKSGYGILVRALDFSAFTSVGLGRTGKMNKEIQMVTHDTILKMLDLCPNLHEFCVAESVDMDIDARILNRLLQMPLLEAMDFCGSTSKKGFITALETSHFTLPGITATPADEDGALLNPCLSRGEGEVATCPTDMFDANDMGPLTAPISTPPIDDLGFFRFAPITVKKLSFHGCSTIPADLFIKILPRLTHITHLDLTHTLVTPEALLSLPATARLTHLSLAKCVKLSSHGLLKFLLLHPATRHLEWLNLMYDVTKPSPLSYADFDTILRYLPPSLTYLNLSGLPVKDRHLPTLQAMTSLRGLSLGHANIEIPALTKFLSAMSSLVYVDLTGIPNSGLWLIQAGTLFEANPHIDIFEFSAEVLMRLRGVKIPGFGLEIGKARRGWLYRQFTKIQTTEIATMPANINSSPKRTTGFSFSSFAQERLRKHSSLSKQLGEFQAETQVVFPKCVEEHPSFEYASRKVNVSQIGIAGSHSALSRRQRGIFAYYAYHI